VELDRPRDSSNIVLNGDRQKLSLDGRVRPEDVGADKHGTVQSVEAIRQHQLRGPTGGARGKSSARAC